MYKNNNSSQRRGHRSGARGFKQGAHRSSHNSRKSSQKKNKRDQHIDESKFINRATENVQEDVYTPAHTFSDFALDASLQQNIQSKGFSVPTPIQDQAIPHILEGKDLVGIANTGTGKTLAFVVPLLNKMRHDNSTNALIIAPTRELAQQIDDEIRKLSTGLGIFSVVCVGGLPIGKQIASLRRKYNIVVGTPGRLMDLRKRGSIDLSRFQSVVLDEADRMLDMGFIRDIETLMQDTPSTRHTLFFSATMSPDIERLIHRFLNNHITVSVKTRDTSKNVDQDVLRIPQDGSKVDILTDLLRQQDFNKVLVFGRTKRGVEHLSRSLTKKGLRSESIHGDKTQSSRKKALSSFKDNRSQILVATDVAARGLDIPNVSHVINFDVPATYDDYVHRIGRTGRGSNTGKALTFVDAANTRGHHRQQGQHRNTQGRRR